MFVVVAKLVKEDLKCLLSSAKMFLLMVYNLLADVEIVRYVGLRMLLVDSNMSVLT